ncbi:hypothetical protein [Enterococcus sp.]|nr:hypothetical protein [Enterococcus sp.]MDU5334002.1 hypothetical protein [Enterococcus sp.]
MLDALFQMLMDVIGGFIDAITSLISAPFEIFSYFINGIFH